MAAKKFGYVRVSTREQNPDRQIHILRDEEGIDERDIYVEKESGRQFERPVYRSLVDNILILSILVDTFFARISMPKQQYPEIHNISAA